MIKRKYVRTRSLQNGMKIDQAIIDRMGRTLIARGAILDDYMIEALMNRGVSGVYTVEGEEDGTIEKENISEKMIEKIEELKVEDRANVKLTESVKKRVATGIAYLYNNTESDDFIDATNNIANDLMKAITDNESIAVDISALKVSEGYPLGVPEEKIYEYAKIISTADIYDALVTERPYKKAFSPRAAVEMIMAMTDELDINVMRSFLDSIILYPVGSTVQLSNGENAKVIENNPKYVLRPKVFGLKTGKVYDLGNDLKCANIIIK